MPGGISRNRNRLRSHNSRKECLVFCYSFVPPLWSDHSRKGPDPKDLHELVGEVAPSGFRRWPMHAYLLSVGTECIQVECGGLEPPSPGPHPNVLPVKLTRDIIAITKPRIPSEYERTAHLASKYQSTDFVSKSVGRGASG